MRKNQKAVAESPKDCVENNQFFDNSLLSVSQIGRWLNVPVKTIRHWVYRREIPHYKIGRHLRFNSQEIRSWISERGIEHEH